MTKKFELILLSLQKGKNSLSIDFLLHGPPGGEGFPPKLGLLPIALAPLYELVKVFGGLVGSDKGVWVSL